MAKKASGRGLDLKARLTVDEAIRNAQRLKKELKGLGVEMRSSVGNTRPISEFQTAQLKMQQALRDARLETERLKISQQSLKSEIELGRVAAQGYKTEVERLKVAEQDLKNALQQGKITQQQYNQQLLQGRAAQQAQVTALNASKQAAQDARTQIAQLNLQQKQTIIAARQAAQAHNYANGSYDAAKRRLAQLGREIRSTTDGFRSQSPALQDKIHEYSALNDGLKKFDASMGNHQRNVGNYSGAINGAVGALSGLAAGFLSATALLQQSFTTALRTDAIKTSMEYIFNSTDIAEQKMKDLRVTSERLGLEYVSLAEAYRSFAGAAVASNFSLKETDKVFNSVANAGAKLKLSSDQVHGALTALQQMISKGTVQSEELKGQLGERLPGAFAIAARAMGVTQQELGKLLKDGQVLAADLLPKLADELDKTFSNDKTEKVESLQGSVNALKNNFSELVETKGALTAFFKFVVDQAGGVTRAIAKMSQALGIFYDLATRPKEFIGDSAQQSRSASYEQLKLEAAQSAAIQIKNQVSKQEAYALMEREAKLLGEIDAKYKTLKATQDQIKAGDRNLSDTKSLQDQEKSLRFQILLVRGLKSEYDKVYNVKNAAGETPDSELKSVKAIQARITALKKLDGSAIIGDKVFERIEALQARLRKPADTSRIEETALKSRNDMQARIDELSKKGVAKQLSADAEEIESVTRKYDEMRRQAEKFNNDSRNKKMGLRVDSSGLVRAQSLEEDALRDKQTSVKLKETLDLQKKAYDDFESYRNKVGDEKAKERYASLLDTDRNYLDKLQQQREALTDPQKSKGGELVDENAIRQQLKVLDEAIAAEKLVVQSRQDDLVASLMDYNAQMSKLESDHQAALKALGEKATIDELAQLDKQTQLKKQSLGDAHLQELEAFKQLYAGIDRLSDENALKVVGNAEDALGALKAKGVVISKELEAELRRLFADTRRSLAERLPDRLINVANQIDAIAGSVGDLDEGFGKVLGTLGNVVGQVGNIKKGMLDLKAAQSTGDSLGSLGAGLGILGAGISIFQTIFKLFDRSAQREAQASYSRDLQNKQTEALNKALERQVALLDEVYGTERIAKYSEAIAQAQANEEKYQAQLAGRYKLTGDANLDKYITRLNNGEGLGGMLSEADFRKQLEKIGATLPTDIASLQTLLDEGKLDANTSTIVQNLIQANKTAQELANNLRAETVGAGLSTIVDEFISDLTDGMDGVEGSLQNAIRRGLLQGLKSDLTQKYIQEFYAQLDGALKDGQISAEEDKQLQDLYKAAEEYGKKKLDYINSVAPESEGGTPDTLKGRIESITSNQADKLEGVFRAVQVNGIRTNSLLVEGNNWMAQTYQMVSGNLAELVAIKVNTREIADNTKQLSEVKASLASIDKKMNNGTNGMQGNGYTTWI